MTMQPAAVLFPDVELWVTTYLRSALAARAEPYAVGAYVSNRKPSGVRSRTVVVRRDGGAQAGLLDTARVTVRVWADLEQDASDLARLVRALLVASPLLGGPVVSALSSSGPMGIPDDAQPQKLFVVDLTVRGSTL